MLRRALSLAALPAMAMLLVSCTGSSDQDPVVELSEPMKKGRAIYLANCSACHGPAGKGLAGAFPPLAGSDYLEPNREAVIKGVLFGQQGPIVVNGETYNGVMPGFGHLSDDEIAAAISYVFASWGNDLEPVSLDEVARLRAD